MAAAYLVVVDSKGVFSAAHDAVCMHPEAAVHMHLPQAGFRDLKNQLRPGCQGAPLHLLGYHIPQGPQAGVEQEDEGRAVLQVVLDFRQLHTEETG